MDWKQRGQNKQLKAKGKRWRGGRGVKQWVEGGKQPILWWQMRILGVLAIRGSKPVRQKHYQNIWSITLRLFIFFLEHSTSVSSLISPFMWDKKKKISPFIPGKPTGRLQVANQVGSPLRPESSHWLPLGYFSGNRWTQLSIMAFLKLQRSVLQAGLEAIWEQGPGLCWSPVCPQELENACNMVIAQ